MVMEMMIEGCRWQRWLLLLVGRILVRPFTRRRWLMWECTHPFDHQQRGQQDGGEGVNPMGPIATSHFVDRNHGVELWRRRRLGLDDLCSS